jgi:hypothetical protein
MLLSDRFAPEAAARKLIRQVTENLLLVGISGPCPSKIRATRSTNSVGCQSNGLRSSNALELTRLQQSYDVLDRLFFGSPVDQRHFFGKAIKRRLV